MAHLLISPVAGSSLGIHPVIDHESNGDFYCGAILKSGEDYFISLNGLTEGPNGFSGDIRCDDLPTLNGTFTASTYTWMDAGYMQRGSQIQVTISNGAITKSQSSAEMQFASMAKITLSSGGGETGGATLDSIQFSGGSNTHSIAPAPGARITIPFTYSPASLSASDLKSLIVSPYQTVESYDVTSASNGSGTISITISDSASADALISLTWKRSSSDTTIVGGVTGKIQSTAGGGSVTGISITHGPAEAATIDLGDAFMMTFEVTPSSWSGTPKIEFTAGSGESYLRGSGSGTYQYQIIPETSSPGGYVTVRFTAGEKSVSRMWTAQSSQPSTETISLSPSSISLAPGGSRDITATVNPSSYSGNLILSGASSENLHYDGPNRSGSGRWTWTQWAYDDATAGNYTVTARTTNSQANLYVTVTGGSTTETSARFHPDTATVKAGTSGTYLPFIYTPKNLTTSAFSAQISPSTSGFSASVSYASGGNGSLTINVGSSVPAGKYLVFLYDRKTNRSLSSCQVTVQAAGSSELTSLYFDARTPATQYVTDSVSGMQKMRDWIIHAAPTDFTGTVTYEGDAAFNQCISVVSFTKGNNENNELIYILRWQTLGVTGQVCGIKFTGGGRVLAGSIHLNS